MSDKRASSIKSNFVDDFYLFRWNVVSRAKILISVRKVVADLRSRNLNYCGRVTAVLPWNNYGPVYGDQPCLA